jgi:dipeptidase
MRPFECVPLSVFKTLNLLQQARIRTFPLNDPSNAIYSPDVITFARNLSLFNGTDAEFSFSDTYDPVSFSGARFCEARVWNFFKSIMGEVWAAPYVTLTPHTCTAFWC